MARTKADAPFLLIDGDIYAYKAASATEQIVTFDDAVYHRVAHLPDVIVAFEDKIAGILKRWKTKDYIIALTDGENFRKGILPTYKANRNPATKPLCLSALREHILNGSEHRTYMRPGLEADDILGILATSTKIIAGNPRRIIVSVDKDMRCVPGEYWNSQHNKLYRTSEDEAAYNHMFQTLTGDVTDGYGGCPMVGPVKAARLLDGLTGYEELWPAVVAAFEKKKLTEEVALTQARMARILRVTDYNFKEKKVILWKPPKTLT